MLLAARFLLVLALLLGTHAQCPPGSHQAAADNILLVTDDVGDPRSQDVQWKLMNTDSFSVICSMLMYPPLPWISTAPTILCSFVFQPQNGLKYKLPSISALAACQCTKELY